MSHTAFLVLLAALVLGGRAALGAEAMMLVREGKAECDIVVPANASEPEKRGAEELRKHLQQMSGAQLRIMTEAEALPQRAILVGRTRHAEALGVKIDPAALGPEGFVLKAVGGHVVVAGGGDRGTMYGCTTLLEKLGVRWFTPKVTYVPKSATVSLDALDERQGPAFEYREVYFTEAFDKDWAARLKTNGASTKLDASTGGKVTYYPFVHSFDTLIPPALYEKHPEYFPLIDGKRKNGYVQRCLSNPEVLALAIENVRGWMKSHPAAMIYSVSQNDCYEFCTCDKCKALTGEYGANSGLYLWFVNQIAEAVEKDFPGKLIDTLAYQFTEQCPKGIVPRKNVRVRLCPIAVCEAHPYEKCTAKPTVTFMANLAAWGRITDTLYIWHYNTNFAHYLLPFPDFEEFPADIRLYKASGVKGIFFEGAYGAGGGGSDADLRSYVMAKLLWEPTMDSNALVNEWMAGVYGPAAKPMRQWFDLLHAKARNPDKHFFIYDPPTMHYLSADVIEAGDKLFDEAQKLAEGNDVAAEYVAKSRLCLRYVKLMQKPAAGAELDSFVADLRKFGIQDIREGQKTEAWEKAYRAKLKK